MNEGESGMTRTAVAGVMVISFTPFYFCKGPGDFESFIERLVSL